VKPGSSNSVWPCLLCAALMGMAASVNAQPPRGALGGPPIADAASGRIIVKYTPAVLSSPARLLAAQIPLETVTGTPSLDRLHQRLGVTAAYRLFGDSDTLNSHTAEALWRGRLSISRGRFPQRTARAPFGVQAPDISHIFVVELDESVDVTQAAVQYAADPSVEWAEPDYVAEVAVVPNDPFYSSVGTWGQSYEDLYGLHLTQASLAWDLSGGEGIVIAIVDTGIDETHPDIAANIWTNPGGDRGQRYR